MSPRPRRVRRDRRWAHRAGQAVSVLALLVVANLLVWAPPDGRGPRAQDVEVSLVQATPEPAPSSTPSATPSASASPSPSPSASPRRSTTPSPRPSTAASTTRTAVQGSAAARGPARPAPVFARPSGMPWASGVFLEDATPRHLARYEEWLGRPVDLVQVWTERETWGQVTAPVDHLRPWSGHRLVIGAALYPRTGASTAACARGEYDDHWQTFGRTLADNGFGDSVVRLGWEFNGSWYVWRAEDPAAFVRCWRHVVDAVREQAPDVVWDWSVNRGPSGALDDPRRAYPGDDYVDLIGISSYDHWPAATSAAVFQDEQVDGPQGLQHWAAFARSRGKKMSVPEWGNRTTGPSVGGDNPDYVRWMRQFFADNADLIAYEAVFLADGGQYDEGRALPRSAQAYRSGFGPAPAD